MCEESDTPLPLKSVPMRIICVNNHLKLRDDIYGLLKFVVTNKKMCMKTIKMLIISQ